MDSGLVIFLGLGLGLVIVGLIWMGMRLSHTTRLLGEMKDQSANNPATVMLHKTVEELRKSVSDQSQSLNQTIQKQYGDSQKIIQDVTERLTKLDETNKQVVDFSDQLRDLQDILQNPKQRGELGEFFLETLLGNVLAPGQWKPQYEFQDGQKVDAVIIVRDKLIPVDAKFSLENYKRLIEARDPAERDRLEKTFKQDVKNRIDETSKYIRPSEGTLDFAFMFIPAEAIYYDLLVNKVGAAKINTRDLIEYAFKDKKVIIVSPTSFLAYLQTVLQGLRAMKIEESAKEIRERVDILQKHLKAYEGYMERLGKQIDTTQKTFLVTNNEFNKIDKDVVKIGEIEVKEVEPVLLEKPSID